MVAQQPLVVADITCGERQQLGSPSLPFGNQHDFCTVHTWGVMWHRTQTGTVRSSNVTRFQALYVAHCPVLFELCCSVFFLINYRYFLILSDVQNNNIFIEKMLNYYLSHRSYISGSMKPFQTLNTTV